MEFRTKPRKRRWKYLLWLLLLLPLIAGWMFYQSKLNLVNYDDGQRQLDTELDLSGEVLDIPEVGVEPDNADELSQIPEGDVVFDSDVINILLLGTDERTEEFSDNARADAIMILSLNTKEHTIKLVSIERGIGVPIEGRNDDWITHTFRYGGAALTMQTVRDCFKVDVERYVRVNFNVFKRAIDTVGGVDIELTQAEADHLNSSVGASIYGSGLQQVRAGINHLDGTTALAYARIRKIDSDWKRIERQRTVIQATIDQVTDSDLAMLNELTDTILSMVQTNLTKGEITNLLLELPGFIAIGAQMEQMTVPAADTCWNKIGVDGRNLIGVDFTANAEILCEFFYGQKNIAE